MEVIRFSARREVLEPWAELLRGEGIQVDEVQAAPEPYSPGRCSVVARVTMTQRDHIGQTLWYALPAFEAGRRHPLTWNCCLSFELLETEAVSEGDGELEDTKKKLIGKAVKKVRRDAAGSLVIVFDDGTKLKALADEEGNAAGVFEINEGACRVG